LIDGDILLFFFRFLLVFCDFSVQIHPFSRASCYANIGDIARHCGQELVPALPAILPVLVRACDMPQCPGIFDLNDAIFVSTTSDFVTLLFIFIYYCYLLLSIIECSSLLVMCNNALWAFGEVLLFLSPNRPGDSFPPLCVPYMEQYIQHALHLLHVEDDPDSKNLFRMTFFVCVVL
jgi:hypothetical protein